MKPRFPGVRPFFTRPVFLALLAMVGLFAAGGAMAAAPKVKVLQFTTTVGNTLGAGITLGHADLNNKPHLDLIVTQCWTGVYNPHPVGVYYSGTTWHIENEDGASMPLGTVFNVRLGASLALATALNSFYDYTLISPGAKNPAAIILATHWLNPLEKGASVSVPKNQGVFYDPFFKKWAVFNEDISAPAATAYNVIQATGSTAFTVTTTSTNIGGDAVFIDNPVTNNNANAVIFVTAHYGNYWDHPLGVYYANGYGKWGIFNEDSTTMPSGQEFNVEVFPAPAP